MQHQDNSNKKSELKWTNEFSYQNIVWYSAYLIEFRCTNDVTLRNFQYCNEIRLAKWKNMLTNQGWFITYICYIYSQQKTTGFQVCRLDPPVH